MRLTKGLAYAHIDKEISKSYLLKSLDLKPIYSLEYAATLHNLGDTAAQPGESREFYSRALEILSRINGKEKTASHAILLNNIGTILAKEGDYANALTNLLESLEIKQMLKQETCTILSNIGDVYVRQREYTAALEYLEKSMKETRNEVTIATIKSRMAHVRYEMADYESARDLNSQALHVYKNVNKRPSSILFSQGKTCVALNEYQSAKSCLLECLQIYDCQGEKFETLELLASVHLHLKDYDAAIKTLEESLKSSSDPKKLKVLISLAETYCITKNPLALQRFTEALKLYNQIKINHDETLIVILQGLCKNDPHPLKYYTQLQSLERKIGISTETTDYELVKVYVDEMMWDDALALAKDSDHLLRLLRQKVKETGNSEIYSHILHLLGQTDKVTCLIEMGDSTLNIEYYLQALELLKSRDSSNRRLEVLKKIAFNSKNVGQVVQCAKEGIELSQNLKMDSNELQTILLKSANEFYNLALQSDLDNSIKLLIESLDLSSQDLNLEIKVLELLGNNQAEIKDHKSSIATRSRLISILRKEENKVKLAVQLNEISKTSLKIADYSSALKAAQESFEINHSPESISQLKSIASLYYEMGGKEFNQKDYKQAIEYYTQSLSIYCLLTLERETAVIKSCLSKVHADLKEYDKALKLLLAALETYRSLDLKQETAQALEHIGEISESVFDCEDAITKYTEVLGLIGEEKVGRQRVCQKMVRIALAYYEKAEAMKNSEEKDDTFTLYKKAYEILLQCHGKVDRDVAKVLFAICLFLTRQGNYDAALSKLRELREIHQAVGMGVEDVDALTREAKKRGKKFGCFGGNRDVKIYPI